MLAISREAFEEAHIALHTTNWDALGHFSDDKTFLVHVFAAIGDLSCARQKTDEAIAVFDREQAQELSLAPGIADILAPWLSGGQLVNSNAPRGSLQP